mmetsp:Transcript_4354/g.16404  ORF Transcript_4354/g.16404 Transcript_4354/m.16404 type:complete len:288 (+) Transcript_4354:1674-2537(+)
MHDLDQRRLLRVGLQEVPKPGQGHADEEDVDVAQGVELEEDHGEIQGLRVPEGVPVVPPQVAGDRGHDDDSDPGQGASDGEGDEEVPEGLQGGDHQVQHPEQGPIDHHARQEPALHLQRPLGDPGKPSLAKPRLKQQHQEAWAGVLRLREDTCHEQRRAVEGVDGDRAPRHVAEHGLGPGPPGLRREEDEAREHEEPRHPSEAPTEDVDIRDRLPCVQVAGDNVQGSHTPGEAERELLPRRRCARGRRRGAPVLAAVGGRGGGLARAADHDVGLRDLALLGVHHGVV